MQDPIWDTIRSRGFSDLGRHQFLGDLLWNDVARRDVMNVIVGPWLQCFQVGANRMEKIIDGYGELFHITMK